MIAFFHFLKSLCSNEWYGELKITYRKGLIIKVQMDTSRDVSPYQAGWEQPIPGEE